MSVDRDATLKNAEKLLKQGKLAGAIEEYVRLVEDRPSDWTIVNALGDLYVKAGDMTRAAAEFTRAADHLYGEGFLPRASAVYKKVLKVKPDDDHALWRLADIAGRQGLSADAKSYYARLIRDRRAAGDEQGVVDCLIRVGQLADADVEAKMTAARALADRYESKQAARLVFGAAELLIKDGRQSEALDALRHAAELDPDDVEIGERLAALTPAYVEEPAVETPSAGESITTEPETSYTEEMAPSGGDGDLPADAAVVDVADAKEQPEPPLDEPPTLESIFAELTDRVAREQRAREEKP